LELLLVRPLEDADGEWEVLVRGTPRPGERVHLAEGAGEWVVPLRDGTWRLKLVVDGPVLAWLERVGEVPLPPYVARPGGPTASDRERYQTVYAAAPGAVAAPTAGLHFTPALLATLASAGVEMRTLTLHVGPGTFQPIRTDTLGAHVMAPQRYVVPPGTAWRGNGARAPGRRTGPRGTPAFMPVGTLGSVKGLTPRQLDEVGADIVLANAYHLAQRPGVDTVAALGGLHALMGWHRPILTDSGGYQLMSLAELVRVEDEGVHYRSHVDGHAGLFRPEDAIRAQEALGVDVAMSLDE